MTYEPGRSFLKGASRGALSGDTITLSTTKQYFESKTAILAGSATPDAVWQIKGGGTVTTGLVGPTLMFRLEFNRSVTVPLGASLLPAINLTTEAWELDIDIICKAAGASGSVIVGGRVGMVLSAGGALTYRPFTGQEVTGLNFDTTSYNVEISVQSGLSITGSTIIMSRFLVPEMRQR